VYYKGNRFAVVGHGAEYASRIHPGFRLGAGIGIVLARAGATSERQGARAPSAATWCSTTSPHATSRRRENGCAARPGQGQGLRHRQRHRPGAGDTGRSARPYNLAMTARINGEEWSRGHSSGMRFTFEDIIAYVSQNETLYPANSSAPAPPPCLSRGATAVAAASRWGASCKPRT